MMFLRNSGGGGGGTNSGSGGSGNSGGFMGLFEKKPSPEELTKEWKRNIQKEIRKIDRDISAVKRAEQKSINECKALAKKGRTPAVKILAKEIVNTRKTIERMYVAKAQLGSVQNNLQTQLSMLKVSGCMQKSAEVMGAMNKLVNLAEVSETMRSMAREMEKAGLVEEIVGDALDSMEPEGLDAEADREADKIVEELTSGILSPAGAAPMNTVKQPAAATQEAQEPAAAAEDSAAADLMSRLQAL